MVGAKIITINARNYGRARVQNDYFHRNKAAGRRTNIYNEERSVARIVSHTSGQNKVFNDGVKFRNLGSAFRIK